MIGSAREARVLYQLEDTSKQPKDKSTLLASTILNLNPQDINV
ncbi:hypothetical protein LINPERPRIM_LOCUS6528, partial [Linum perenne]